MSELRRNTSDVHRDVGLAEACYSYGCREGTLTTLRNLPVSPSDRQVYMSRGGASR
jgi:hypothetical protein